MTDAPPCIAIINDYWDFIDILTVHLERRGYRAVGARMPDLAKDGTRGAVRFFEQHDPDVVIFDIAPPVEDHVRYLEAIRPVEARRGRKFVLTTTLPQAVSGYQCTDGIVALFGKPLRVDALLAAVDNALRERGRAA
jgi:CheY-like chemotaxis protein